MLDEWLTHFDALRRAGAIVILKWDGERSQRVYTFVITRHDTDFAYRRDTDDLTAAIAEGIRQFWAAHPDSTT